MSKDDKKEIESIITEELQKCAWVVYSMGLLKHFVYYFSCLIFFIKIFKSI